MPISGVNDSSSQSESLEFQTDLLITLDGPSYFSGETRYLGNGRYLAFYEPIDPGIYEMRVEIFKKLPKAPNANIFLYDFWQPLGSSPYTVVVSNIQELKSVTTSVALDQPPIVNPALCRDLDVRHSRYVRCQDIGWPCTRTGWVWLPRDCHFKLYSRTELVNLVEPTWIVVAGSSVIRGTFLAGVDYLLGDRAANLTDSKIWKCWGWLDIRVSDHLRLSYLDLRFPCTHFYGAEPAEYCQQDYPAEIEKSLRQIGAGDKGPKFGKGGGPDVFYLEIYTAGQSTSI